MSGAISVVMVRWLYPLTNNGTFKHIRCYAYVNKNKTQKTDNDLQVFECQTARVTSSGKHLPAVWKLPIEVNESHWCVLYEQHVLPFVPQSKNKQKSRVKLLFHLQTYCMLCVSYLLGAPWNVKLRRFHQLLSEQINQEVKRPSSKYVTEHRTFHFQLDSSTVYRFKQIQTNNKRVVQRDTANQCPCSKSNQI